jgi:hypothetical protein
LFTKFDNRLAPGLPHAPNDAALAAPKGATPARDTSTPASIVFNIILITVFSLVIIALFRRSAEQCDHHLISFINAFD